MWTKLSDDFFRNPKVVAAGRDARDLYLVALCHCNEHLTDGFIAAGYLRRLAADAEIDSANESARALVTVGLWLEAEGGWLIHDFATYNPTKEQVENERRQVAERKERWKERRSERVPHAVPNNAPVPVPVPRICTPSTTTYIPREEDELLPIPTGEENTLTTDGENTLTADLESDPYLPPPPMRRKAQRKANEERREQAVAIIAAFRAARFGTQPGAAIPPAEYERMKQAAFDLLSAEATPEVVARATCAALERWSDDSRVTLAAIAGNLTALLAPVHTRPAASSIRPTLSDRERRRDERLGQTIRVFDSILEGAILQ